MSLSVRKFIAVLMAIWLPLFGGSALAASVSMQMSSKSVMEGACHEAGMMTESAMDHQMQHDDSLTSQSDQDHQSGSCSSCGVCHLACSGYLLAPDIHYLSLPHTIEEMTDYAFSFRSTHPAPLLPPPLARA